MSSPDDKLADPLDSIDTNYLNDYLIDSSTSSPDDGNATGGDPGAADEALAVDDADVLSESPGDFIDAGGVSMKMRALSLFEKDLTVIPLGSSGGKLKRPRVAWAIYQKEDVTEERIAQWWSTWPNSNIGIVTGKDLVVVDADTPEAIKWCREILPTTQWEVTTGKGVHFLSLIHI